MSFRATCFDGRSSAASELQIGFDGELLTVHLPGQIRHYRRGEYQITTVAGDGGWSIECLDGLRLEISDARFARAWLQQLPWHRQLLERLSQRMAFVLTALLLSIAFVYWLLTDGVPLVASALASVFPPRTEQLIGESISRSGLLHDQLFRPSTLPADRQQALRERLAKLCAGDPDCPGYRLEFRASPLGPNAFALPGGQIIVTDDLFSLAEDEDELIAVLAHELGHVAHRHALQRLLQSSMRGLVMVVLTGDVDSIASALPGMMLDLKYSRELETEADRFSLAFLQRHCIPPAAFASLMARLSAAGGESEQDASPGLLSTHPAPAERLAVFRGATSGTCAR